MLLFPDLPDYVRAMADGVDPLQRQNLQFNVAAQTISAVAD
jgi:hypothetical protein